MFSHVEDRQDRQRNPVRPLGKLVCGIRSLCFPWGQASDPSTEPPLPGRSRRAYVSIPVSTCPDRPRRRAGSPATGGVVAVSDLPGGTICSGRSPCPALQRRIGDAFGDTASAALDAQPSRGASGSSAPQACIGVALPSGTQAGPLAGRPILMRVNGDAADGVRSLGAGVGFEAGGAATLAAAPAGPRAFLRQATGRRGHEFLEARLSRSIGIRGISALINRPKKRSSRLNCISGDSI